MLHEVAVTASASWMLQDRPTHLAQCYPTRFGMGHPMDIAGSNPHSLHLAMTHDFGMENSIRKLIF